MNLAEIPVVILAGGRGARFDHESQVKPKPMIEVAGKPMLQHIIDGFVAQGFREFIVATGYLGSVITDYFNEGTRYVSLGHNSSERDDNTRNGWKFSDGATLITVYDTGLDSHTGERLRRLRHMVGKRRFILTYGDGLSDVPMAELIEFHGSQRHSASSYGLPEHPAQMPLVTVTAVNPPGRFGVLTFNGTFRHYVRSFYEKGANDWINGGFMVCEPEFIDRYIDDGCGNAYQLEAEGLLRAARDWMLRGYRHNGFWMCMDTRRDLEAIEQVVADNGGKLPWIANAKDSD